MVKLSKKAITAISISSAAVIAGATVTAAVLIKQEQSDQKDKPINPLDRDKNYHRYSIVNKLKTNTKLTNLISLVKSDNSFFYVIDELKFKDNIKNIIQETFQSISIFSTNWNSYKLEVSYKIEQTNLIKVDLVWYLPNSKTKYYDQFELLLQTN